MMTGGCSLCFSVTNKEVGIRMDSGFLDEPEEQLDVFVTFHAITRASQVSICYIWDIISEVGVVLHRYRIKNYGKFQDWSLFTGGFFLFRHLIVAMNHMRLRNLTTERPNLKFHSASLEIPLRSQQQPAQPSSTS